MALPRFFYGYWKISDSVPGRHKRCTKDINETEFQLTTTGNVVWKTAKKTTNFPLLNCKVYVVHKSSYLPYCKLKFATSSGHIVDCDVESIQSSGGFVFNDGWCTYTCRKIRNKYGEYPMETQFNFLPALQNGYFSDLVIKAKNRKEFLVHRCILKNAAPKLNWDADPPPLSGYPEEILSPILYFLYSGCLPYKLTDKNLKKLISVAKETPGMEDLVSLCFFQKENLALKNKIINLVLDVGVCLTKMMNIFANSEGKYKMFSYEFDLLYSAVKSSIQEGAVVVAKFLLICKLYASAGTKLSQEDDLEILEHILSKITVFNNYLREYAQNLIGTIKRIHSIPDYWDSLMVYLVPKVKNILENLSSILRKIGENSAAVATALQDHYDDFYVDSSKYLESEFDKSSLSTVLFFAKEFKGLVFHFEKEKTRFCRIDDDSKARLISLALEEFLTEVTGVKSSFEEFLEFLEKQVIKGKIYFGMRIIALKVNDLLKRFLARRTALVDLFLQICDLVERDSFFDCVALLGFLNPPEDTTDTEKKDKKQEIDRFPVVESACKSPPAYLSHLSVMGNLLLDSRDLNDMIFEVICTTELEGSVKFTDSDSDDSDSDSISNSDPNSETKDTSTPDRIDVKVHRAIVCSRCDWFRLALASGMKEEITRKIELHMTPSLFSLFIEFLYTGCFTRLRVTFDDFLKLLLLSDRYDFEHLKQVCEYQLRHFIDEECVFILFYLADRHNANKLKIFCEDFITENPSVVSSDRFRDLPDNLKREAIICSKGYTTKNTILATFFCNDSLEEVDDSLSTLKKRLTGMGLLVTDYEKMATALRPKLEKAMKQLQERIGSEVSRRVLIRTILDADYDVKRAALLHHLRSQIV